MAVTTAAPRRGTVMPALRAWSALVMADVTAMGKSWVLRGWLIILALTEMIGFLQASNAGKTAPVPASTLLAYNLGLFVLVWSTVIIVLSAGAVSLEADIVSDSILSRACTRTQYILSKWVARVLVLVGAYAVFAGIAGFVAWRYAANDMTVGTMLLGIGVVGLSVLLLVSLGITFSVLFNNTIFAVVGLLLLWYVASPVFNFLGAEYLSPASFTRNLPLMLKDTNAPQIVQCSAAESSVTLVFSKRLDPRLAETPESYTVDTGNDVKQVPETATYDEARSAVTLAGLTLPPGQHITVSAAGVTDRGGNRLSPAADQADAIVPGKASSATATPAPAPARRAAALQVQGCEATGSSLRVRFSAPLDRKSAETPENYIVESPPGTPRPFRAASYNAGSRSVLLSGLGLAADDNVKLTVKSVKAADGAELSPRANTATYSSVTPWRYVLGFGLPTLITALLSVAWFSRRDL